MITCFRVPMKIRSLFIFNEFDFVWEKNYPIFFFRALPLDMNNDKLALMVLSAAFFSPPTITPGKVK